MTHPLSAELRSLAYRLDRFAPISVGERTETDEGTEYSGELPPFGECVILLTPKYVMFGGRFDSGYEEGWSWCREYGTPDWNKKTGRWEFESVEDDDIDVIGWQRLPVPGGME